MYKGGAFTHFAHARRREALQPVSCCLSRDLSVIVRMISDPVFRALPTAAWSLKHSKILAGSPWRNSILENSDCPTFFALRDRKNSQKKDFDHGT